VAHVHSLSYWEDWDRRTLGLRDSRLAWALGNFNFKGKVLSRAPVAHALILAPQEAEIRRILV
jgi:hypothetical protein